MMTKRNHSFRTLVMMAVATLATAVLVMLPLTVRSAHAATTFTVNSTSDSTDGFCNAQHCTLREAIDAANATPNSGGPDLIHFDIGGEGVRTISPTSPLPIISSPVIIDGYTQPGSSPNTLSKGTNAKLMIELDGSNTSGLFPDGLVIGSSLFDASGTVVRGLVINGFDDDGIEINAPATGVKVEGNLIGTKANGTWTLGNSDDGVDFFGTGADDNLVGGAKPAKANVIAFNGSDGVQVDAFSGDAPAGNRILRNSIFSNVGLGIDLVGPNEDGRTDVSTKNDPGDKDAGPNGLQNKPAIRSATNADGKTIIKGTLSSKPNQSYVVRFFSNPKGNEGKTFIGQKKVTTNSDGNVSFTFSPTQRVGVGKTLAATATGAEGTFEFSAAKEVVQQ